MTLSRRQTIKLGLGALTGAALTARPAAAAPYLEDARTARTVTLRAPRTTLESVLGVLTQAAGVTLEAAPDLRRQSLVGFVPRRPLRETMAALEDLFDATWAVTGAPAVYRLTPDPVRKKAWDLAREKQLQEMRKRLDIQAAEAVKKSKTEPLPTLDSARRELFALLLWNEVPAAAKLQVLRGGTVSHSIPQARAHPIYDLACAIASKENRKLVSPLIATLDLDDRGELGLPAMRARATGMRESSIVGAIQSLEFYKPGEPPRPKVADGPVLPQAVGKDGTLSGTRDEMAIGLGEEGGVPVLSRQRATGGSGPAFAAGGRPVGQVAADLAVACDCRLVSNSRGFVLLRSNTEHLDAAGHLPESLSNFLRKRPEPGSYVPLEVLAELAALSPLQVAILQRSNVCTEETITVRELYTVLDFYRSLSPELRQALVSPTGVEASRLSHAQLHALLGDKALRANWEVHSPLQEMKGLAFRVRQVQEDGQPALALACLRNGQETEGTVVVELPKAGEEERPTATR